MPTTRTTAATTASGRLAGAGANAAAATSRAGAIASSSECQVALSGSALTSAEIVISCAAPARISAPRIQAQLGGAGTAAWRAMGAALVVGAVSSHFSPTSDRPLWSPNAVVGSTLFLLQPGGTHDAVAGARRAETGDVTWISFVPVRELPGISGTMKRPRPVLPRWLRESTCLVRTKSYDGAVPTKRSMNRKDQSHGAARARAALGPA